MVRSLHPQRRLSSLLVGLSLLWGSSTQAAVSLADPQLQTLAARLAQRQAVRVIVEYDSPQALGEVLAQLNMHLMATPYAWRIDPSYRQLPQQVLSLATPQALTALAQIPAVRAIYPDTLHQLTLTESLSLIQAPTAHDQGALGEGTAVAVLDTGIDPQRLETCLGSDAACRVAEVLEIASPDGQADDNGHGTNVAGIVLGVAPKTTLVGFDVVGPSGIYNSDVLRALDWILAQRARYPWVAVNMSFGNGMSYSRTCVSPFTTSFRYLREAGIAPVVAAGNSGFTGGITHPACVSGALSVGAVYDAAIPGPVTYPEARCTDPAPQPDQIACFSNSGSLLTLLAPGAPITAGGITMSGTSQASPHVSGAIAALRARNLCPSLFPDDLTRIFRATGRSIVDPRNRLTFSRLQLAAALTQAQSSPQCTTPRLPDLVVTSFSSSLSRSTLSIRMNIRNSGSILADNVRTGVYFSTDRVLDADDRLLGHCALRYLGINETLSCSTGLSVSGIPRGSYFVIVRADDPQLISEMREDNNILVSSGTIRF